MCFSTAMYTPRMLDSQAVSHGMVLPGNSSAAVIASAMDTASDSAVSSMGSERGPSIAEGDWIDNSASDSNATSSAATAVNVTSASAYTMDYSSGYLQSILSINLNNFINFINFINLMNQFYQFYQL